MKWFNTTKGYGFIGPDDGSKDVFVHILAVKRAGLGTLRDGMTDATIEVAVHHPTEEDQRAWTVSWNGEEAHVRPVPDIDARELDDWGLPYTSRDYTDRWRAEGGDAYVIGNSSMASLASASRLASSPCTETPMAANACSRPCATSPTNTRNAQPSYAASPSTRCRPRPHDRPHHRREMDGRRRACGRKAQRRGPTAAQRGTRAWRR